MICLHSAAQTCQQARSRQVLSPENQAEPTEPKLRAAHTGQDETATWVSTPNLIEFIVLPTARLAFRDVRIETSVHF